MKNQVLESFIIKWELSPSQGAKVLRINKSKVSEYLSKKSDRTLPIYVEAHIETFNLLSEKTAKKLIEKRLKQTLI